ncbi:MAG TPA: DUF5615 family PIN-like protein [Armatimonadota bacterium]
MDENVNGAITTALRICGMDVLAVQQEQGEGASDPDVLDHATLLNRVLFSQDRDLLAEAMRRQNESIPFVGLVYAQQQRVSIAQCIDDLEYLARAGNAEDFANRVYFLPL